MRRRVAWASRSAGAGGTHRFQPLLGAPLAARPRSFLAHSRLAALPPAPLLSPPHSLHTHRTANTNSHVRLSLLGQASCVTPTRCLHTSSPPPTFRSTFPAAAVAGRATTGASSSLGLARPSLLLCPTRALQTKNTSDRDAPVGGQPSETPPPSTPQSTVAVQHPSDPLAPNPGLSRFLGHVYASTGMSLSGMLMASYALSLYLDLSLDSFSTCFNMFVGGLGAIMLCVIAMGPTTPRTLPHPEDPSQLVSVNSGWRRMAFTGGMAAAAVLMVPMVALGTWVSPMLVPVAAVAVGGMMGGAALYAYKHPHAHLLGWQLPLRSAVATSVLLSLSGAGALELLGPNPVSSVLLSVPLYVALTMFAGMSALDTRIAIQDYNKGEADHLWHAISFFVSFLLIF